MRISTSLSGFHFTCLPDRQASTPPVCSSKLNNWSR
ncbi:hypothetical protein BMETH_1898_0 [methanotrophic bacterial endosymbiont of Bathymodiolus sp.]|nr:hypothetical protein BMETH_1898_0 [methanotrophic bacterial endosymbiont of Bathymodiolus sp.]